ncbi:MAG: ABC transporter permease, partial [Holophagales bacterium]|nr:ABC transporter permease [Holophagales bacterium]
FLGDAARRSQLVLLGAALLLLLLSCVNVSSLMMARLGDRAREIQLRLALGASRGRIVKQLLTESSLLGLLGAAGGLTVAALAVPMVRRLDVPLPRLEEMSLDLGVVLAVAVVAVVAGLGTGLAPALRLVGTTRAEHLRQRDMGSDPGGIRLRSLLVMAEIALAAMLAVGAGLLLRSFAELDAFDPGFETERVLLAQLDLPTDRYGSESRTAGDFYSRLVERIEGMPQVSSAGATMVDPFRGPRPSNRVADSQERDRNAFLPVQWRSITPGYFRTLEIPLLRGRSLEARETGPLEVVVSSSVAERLWSGGDPLGQELRWIGPEGPLFRVVGIAGEVQDLRLGETPLPTVYLPQRRIGWPSMTVAVRTSGSFEALAEAIREAVRDLDPLLAPPAISTLERQRREALAQPLLSLRSLGVFSAVALVLAVLGVYGIVAYSASRRRREFGLRKALGARPVQLATLVVRGSTGLVAGGIGLGLLGSAAAASSLRAILYRTSPLDVGVLVHVAALLAALGLVAAWLPARRAARLDPLDALREE